MRATWGAVAGTGGTTTYYWSASNGASGNTTGTSTPDITGLAAGSYTVQVFARNDAYQGAAGTSNGVAITQQGIPATPTITGASPANGTYSPSTVSWSWTAVTANPGGSANIQYEVSYNGGGWSGVGTATSYSLGNRGTGDHTLQVRAVNKAGAGGASGTATVSLTTAPPPSNATVIVASACLVPTDNWYAYNNVCGSTLPAGSAIWAECRGVQNGVWWFWLPAYPGGMFIRASDTSTPYTSIPTCG